VYLTEIRLPQAQKKPKFCRKGLMEFIFYRCKYRQKKTG